jgi:hypothetical protein
MKFLGMTSSKSFEAFHIHVSDAEEIKSVQSKSTVKMKHIHLAVLFVSYE